VPTCASSSIASVTGWARCTITTATCAGPLSGQDVIPMRPPERRSARAVPGFDPASFAAVEAGFTEAQRRSRAFGRAITRWPVG